MTGTVYQLVNFLLSFDFFVHHASLSIFRSKKDSIDNKHCTSETLLKGKAQYSWPPCTNLFISAPFYIENSIYIFNKTSYLNEEVNCTEPSPSVSNPWLHLKN
jgi:hypothetical protein